MMKRRSFHGPVLVVLLCVMTLMACGCGAQLGETKAEGERRHRRVMRINNNEMMSDLDRMFLFDKPSRLTDKRIP